MGTGILATLLETNAASADALHPAAVVVLVLAWVALLGLSLGYGMRVARDTRALTSTLTDPAVLPLWGTVAMGLLAVGAATLTVVPTVAAAATSAAVVVDAVLWTLGTGLGLATAFGFAVVLMRRHAGPPTPVWGLPIVPPMVSATTGASLVPHLGGTGARFALVLVASACFAVAATFGVLVFGLAYHHHWRVTPLTVAAAASSWIPLGIVGQSTAAAQAIASQAESLLTPAAAAAAHTAADAYGSAALVVGVPLVAYAVVVTARGFRHRMPFAPGWWALTFPIGTIALGSHLLGAATGSALATLVGWTALATLAGTWALCVSATLLATVRILQARGLPDRR
ncbi:C4-dicarboxylate ABC transporter [Nocardioides sp. CBS4Y-1]|uniref:C4-dicarboxylate ABC transporter n=2 Tax=Nocardioides acrostichi TaxID=2784339 RepID=A0A930V176_9ACTN|nr:C4-dicarboxylate ABC transporter [Nocardioides acrostichi]